MPDLLEENLEQIAKIFNTKRNIRIFSCKQRNLSKTFTNQDNDEEQGIFQFDEDIEKQNEEQEQPLANIFQKIKDKNILAIEELKSQPLMQEIIAEIDAKENPNHFFMPLSRSSSTSSLESKKSQTK